MSHRLFTLIMLMSTFLFAEKPVEFTVSIQTPHPGFRLEILRIDRVEDRTLVLAKIHAPADDGMMFSMVISEISDTVLVEKPLPAPEVMLTGRTWGWGNEPDVGSPERYAKRFPDAEPVPFTRTPPVRD